MTKTFFAGVAEVDITPPPDLPMDGYLAREGTSVGVHDPLMAQVLIVGDGEKRVALVTLDVMAVSAGFTDPLRQALAEKIGTVAAAILICPSHSHCGPVGLQNWFPPGDRQPLNASLVSMTQERILSAAQIALDHMTAVDVVYAQGAVEGIGGDRNQPEALVDNQVTTLCFQRADQQPLCILFHYACHPTVLGAGTRQYSADFVGATRGRLCEQYPGAVSMFLNGALGDISPRYQRRDQSYAEVARLGNCLAEYIINLLGKTEIETDRSLSWDSIPIELPFRTFSPQTALPMVASSLSRIEETRAQGSAIQTTLQQAIGERVSQATTLSLVQIGSWTFCGIPGEPFNRLQTAIRAKASHSLIVGLANDYIGYLPTQAAIDFQSYEALSSPYDARALEQIEAVLTDQLSQTAYQ